MDTGNAVDAVVVLGAPPLTRGVPGPALERRLDHGVAIFRANKAAFLVLSGGSVGPPPAEAEIMRTLAIAHGIPADRIVVEDRAKNTFENALYSGLIMRRRGWQGVIVVTDAFHMPRTLFVFRRLGLRVTGSAVPGRAAARLPTRLRLYLREAVAFIRCIVLFLIGRHKPIVAAVWEE
jgi:uncharacterized SAM-binding protein YcdF (DUF218 family)